MLGMGLIYRPRVIDIYTVLFSSIKAAKRSPIVLFVNTAVILPVDKDN